METCETVLASEVVSIGPDGSFDVAGSTVGPPVELAVGAGVGACTDKSGEAGVVDAAPGIVTWAMVAIGVSAFGGS